MIQINLTDLTRESIYPRVLQTIEDMCDEYNLNKEFGFISTACQDVIEHLLGMGSDFSVNLDVNIESTEVSFLFTSTAPVFENLMEHYSEENILKDLTDSLDISSENTSVSLTFHVKTHTEVARTITQRTSIFKEENRNW